MSARLSSALFAIAFAALARAAAPSAAPPPATAVVGPDAVWSPPAGFLASLHEACDARAGDFGDCFVAEMEKAGAPAAAVGFARRTGNQGYLREFREHGIVDVALAEYPFRANENAVCFLANGEPPMIDVDDPARIDRQALSYNAVYAGIVKAYPNVAIFPGRRTGELAVTTSPLRNGGQRFLVDYSLLDGCHACARVGSLRMAFDFGVEGKFVDTRIAAVRALRR
jgi:hypothetical protein